jgi:long-chain fatty acid transport protein
MRHSFQQSKFIGLSATLVLVALVIVPGLGIERAQAGGLYLNEFATPSMGVAGAGQEAYANDASTNFAFHNPAGMTRLDGNQLSLGVGILKGAVKFDADSDTPFSGGNGGDQAGLAPFLGSHGVLSITDDLKLGMSVFSVAGASLDPNNEWTGRFQVQEINLLTITANPSIAYRVTDWLSLGAGFQALYASLDYKLAAPPINPPAGGNSRVKIDGDDWAFGYNFGALFELNPRTRIGVTYVSELEPNFDGDLKVAGPGGGGLSTSSELKFTFPQLVRVGAYHELSDQWALLGTVGWEDWSSFDSFEVSTDQGGGSIETDWKDTYHFSGGVHYRPSDDWLLQAGITYDTSPVSDGNRTADLPIDRQIRYAAGVQHQLTENLNLGGAFEFIDMGDAKIKSDSLGGNYKDNRIFAFAVNLSYKF